MFQAEAVGKVGDIAVEGCGRVGWWVTGFSGGVNVGVRVVLEDGFREEFGGEDFVKERDGVWAIYCCGHGLLLVVWVLGFGFLLVVGVWVLESVAFGFQFLCLCKVGIFRFWVIYVV